MRSADSAVSVGQNPSTLNKLSRSLHDPVRQQHHASTRVATAARADPAGATAPVT